MVLCTRKVQLYLGVWARVKRRLWRLMLRLIISFLISSGEFRGESRGESLGEILGEPPGEPALGLGMSWMSRLHLCSCGMSSTSDSSELSLHSWLMADSRVRDRCSPALPSNCSLKIGLCRQRDSFLVCSAGVTASGPVLVSIRLSKSRACPWSL